MGLPLVMFSGYNDYAVSNDLIIVYPQASLSFDNPGCQDVLGVTGEDFANKNGVQPKAVMRMIERLVEPKSEDFKYESKNILNNLSRKSWMSYDTYEWIIERAYKIAI